MKNLFFVFLSFFIFSSFFALGTSQNLKKNAVPATKKSESFATKNPQRKSEELKVSLSQLVPPKNKSQITRLKIRSAGLISQKVYKQLTRAYDLSTVKKYEQATQALLSYSKRSHLRKGEQAEILRNIGLLYAQEGSYKQAENYLQKSLDTKRLPYTIHLSVLYNLAQLALQQEQYSKSKNILRKWFSLNENPNPQGYILLAIYYSEKKKTDSALRLVEEAIEKSSSPQESWLKFALSLHIQKGNYEKSRSLLERLVAQSPLQKVYWKQLVGVYLRLNQNKKALATLELAHKMSYLKTENEYLTLAGLYINEEIPLEGAKILDQKMKKNVISKKQKHLRLRAEAYWMARENKKALEFFKEAVKTAKDEGIYITYGNLLLQEEKWKEAETLFRKALTYYSESLKKEKTKTFVRAYLGLGMTLFYQDQYKEALPFFKKAFELDSESSSAFHWIQYTETALQ